MYIDTDKCPVTPGALLGYCKQQGCYKVAKLVEGKNRNARRNEGCSAGWGAHQGSGAVALSTGLGQVVGLVGHLHRHVGHVSRGVDSASPGAAIVVVSVVHCSWLFYVSCSVTGNSTNLHM